MSFSNKASRKLEAGLEQAKAAGVDPDVIQTLQSAVDMFKKRDAFAKESTTAPNTVLANVERATFSHDFQADFDQGKISWVCTPHMICGHLEGQLLKSLVSIQRAKRVLEVGLFTGYGALSMAEALPDDGELVSLELVESLRDLAAELTKDSPHAKKINVKIGPALETAKQLCDAGEKFDMVFLDGAKKDYVPLLKLIFDENLLNEGGTVLIDNTYFMGEACCPDPSEYKTLAYELQEALSSRPYLHKVFLPINDGILMIRRMKDVERDSV